MNATRPPSPPSELSADRRAFLRAGFAGSALLLLGRWLPPARAADSSGAKESAFTYLTEADATMLVRVVPIMLDGTLPKDRGQFNAAVGEILRGIDTTIGHQSLSVRGEIHDLFGVLTKSITRSLLAGVWTSWDKATDEDVREFLFSWRNSRLDTLRTGYIGLNNLIVGSWYGNPKSWARIGYDGPPTIA